MIPIIVITFGKDCFRSELSNMLTKIIGKRMDTSKNIDKKQINVTNKQ